MQRASEILLGMLEAVKHPQTASTDRLVCLWDDVDMSHTDKARAGQKGGMKKVAKGFAKMDAQRLAAISEAANKKRWGNRAISKYVVNGEEPDEYNGGSAGDRDRIIDAERVAGTGSGAEVEVRR